MFTFTKWIAAPTLALGLMFAGDAPKAQAQHSGTITGHGSSLRFDTPGTRVNSYRLPSNAYHYGYGRGYGNRYSNGYYYRGGYGYGYGSPHYHWYPTQIIPHGNHFHVQPGHFHLHHGGH